MNPASAATAAALIALGACSSPREASVPPVVAATTPTPAIAPTCPPAPGLCLTIEPSDTILEVDGEVVGPITSLGETPPHFVPRPPGIYQITLKRPGFVTWRGEVSVRDSPERIDVSLTAATP